jgi:hypothetical protein
MSMTASMTVSARCAEKMAFMTGMYCMETSGEARMHKMRALLRARALAVPFARRCVRHSALDRAPERARPVVGSGGKGQSTPDQTTGWASYSGDQLVHKGLTGGGGQLRQVREALVECGGGEG